MKKEKSSVFRIEIYFGRKSTFWTHCEIFSWNQWNIVSRQVTKSGKFPTFSWKIWNWSWTNWIKFRGPILMVWSSLWNFRFVGLPNRSQSRCKVFALKPHLEATRKDPGLFWPPQPVCQISESYFNGKYLKCKNPLKCMIWTSLVYYHYKLLAFIITKWLTNHLTKIHIHQKHKKNLKIKESLEVCLSLFFI